MKLAEVKVGEVYWTKIGNDRYKVLVVSQIEKRFIVRRVGETKDLPKARSAAALQRV